MDCLPSWIDPELWAEYVQQRKKDKKAMSPRSERERLARLYELKAAGHDPNKSLSEALNGHWLDFYEPQDKSITATASAAVDKTKLYLVEQAEQARAAQSPQAQRARELVMAKIKRVG